MPTPPPSALLLQLFRLQEAERARVGRALHNQVGQALSAIKMGAHLAQSEDDAAIRAEDLHEIVRTSDETVAILRDLHASLHPPQLEAIGLDAALRAEIDRTHAPGAVACALDPLPHVPEAGIALLAFRIGQALLRALAASAGADAQVVLEDAGEGFLLRVHGTAGAPAEAPLWRALAAAAGGRLDDEGGMQWRLRLPYGPTSAMPADPA